MARAKDLHRACYPSNLPMFPRAFLCSHKGADVPKYAVYMYMCTHRTLFGARPGTNGKEDPLQAL